MNKTSRIISALALFALPILIRFLWTNSFPFIYQPKVTTPQFEQATIPEPPTASAPIQPPKELQAAGQIVVIDYAHNNQFFINEIEPFTRALTSRGAITQVYNEEISLEQQLKSASAYVILSPLSIFSTPDLRTVERFVSSGGRLLVFTDPTRGMGFFDITFPDIDSANLLLSSAGIAFSGDYLYNQVDNEGNFRNVKFSQFGEHALTESLQTVVLYGTHSVSTGSGTVLLKASGNTLSSLTDKGGELAGMVLSADGNVLAAGDFTFMTTPFFSVADNALLVERIAEFSLGGEREANLSNFPYLFTGKVTLAPLGEMQLTSSLVSLVSYLQMAFKQNGIELELGEQKSANNRILIGVYGANEETLGLLEKYDIEVDPSLQYVTAPGIGKIDPSGTGFLVLEPGENGNTLIALADTEDNLRILLGMFSLGDLSGCVLQDNLGICSLGEGDSYDDSGYYEEGEYYQEEPLEDPQASPTPAG